MLNRCKLNILIDAVLLLLLAAMAGLGLLIKYVLISGSRQWTLYGENVDLRWCGLDRHQWGTVHLLVAAAFIVFLLLHLIFHWKPLCAMWRSLIPVKGRRFFISAALMLISLVLLVFPAFLKVKPIRMAQGQGHHSEAVRPRLNHSPLAPTSARQHAAVVATEAEKDAADYRRRDPAYITGQMTLGEVENRYHVSVDVLKTGLGLPPGISAGQQLGRLKKRFGFHMSDVERIISRQSASQSK